MPRNATARSRPVPVGDIEHDLNYFLDLKEQADTAESELKSLKPRLLKYIESTNPEFEATKANVNGHRHGQPGRFVITRVHRDSRTFDPKAALELVKKKKLKDVIELHETVNEDAFERLMRAGYFTKAEIRYVLKGAISEYPTVKFKPR